MAKNHTCPVPSVRKQGYGIAELEKRLWDVADVLRANSDLKSSEYSTPVLDLIFLRYADYRFTEQEKILSRLRQGFGGLDLLWLIQQAMSGLRSWNYAKS